MPSAPGVGLPPGMQQSNSAQPGRPGGLPSSFQPPPNMPKIDFSAPVIRLGTSSTGKSSIMTPTASSGARKDSTTDGPMSAGGRPGLGSTHGQAGMEQQRQALRESMMSLAPPTKDEVARTIFIGGITEGAGGDEGIERILQTAGNLRRWNRAIDADGKLCRFGFAEYEDAESLGTAVETLRDVHVPRLRKESKVVKEEDGGDTTKREEDEDMEDVEPKIETTKLLVSSSPSNMIPSTEIRSDQSFRLSRLLSMKTLSTTSSTTAHLAVMKILPELKRAWTLLEHPWPPYSPI